MIHRLSFGILCFCALTLGQGTLWDSVRGETCNRVVAVVHDDVITLHELDKKIKEFTGVEAETIRQKDLSQYRKIQKNVLDRIINDRITQNKINELKIEVTEKEVNNSIEKTMKNNQWSQEDLIAKIQSNGLTFDEYKKGVKENLQKHKLIDYELKSKIIIREEQIENYYRKNKERFKRKEGIELASIFLPKGKRGNSKETINAQEKAEKILENLRNGADFGDMARQHSEGPAARQGGYLGRFDPGQLDPEIRRSLQETPEGGFSDLIIKPNGIQIIHVISKGGGGVLPLDEARQAIRGILLREEIDRRYTAWIQELRKETYTKILF